MKVESATLRWLELKWPIAENLGMRSASLLLALSLGLGAAGDASACRGPFRTLAENFASAKAVFKGTVREVRVTGPTPTLPNSKSLEIELAVDHIYKGKLEKTVVIRGDTTTCGFGQGLSKGDRLVIFAGGEPLGTSAVSGNFALRGRPEEAARLKELEAVASKL